MSINNLICPKCMCYLLDHKELKDHKKCIGCGYTKIKELKDVGILTDWSNPESMISKYFKVKEALYLPSWKCLHIPSDEEKANIIKHANNMDLIRDFLNASIKIHCWIRPILNNSNSPHHGQDYNLLVGGAPHSAHKIGLAADYDVLGLNCDLVRTKLEPMLEQWNMRLEDAPGTNWVHSDSSIPSIGGHRYFKP